MAKPEVRANLSWSGKADRALIEIVSGAAADPVRPDGRQSPRALEIQRGTCRLLRSLGFATLTELSLSTGHRADVVALGRKGDLWIAEIKSSVEDLRADNKWPAYNEHCDRLFFAVGQDMPIDILPCDTGIIVADRFGAAIIREAPESRLGAGRRRQVQMRFARAAALRLHSLIDPDAGDPTA